MRIHWLLFLPVLLSGCHNGSPPSAPLPIAPRPAGFARAVNPADRVKQIPQFQQAEQEFAAGRYAAAASLVEAVERSGGLSAEELRFCRAQRNVCLRRAGRPPVELPAEAPHPRHAGAAAADCGPRALKIAAERLGVHASVERLRKLAGTTPAGTAMEGLAEAAKAIGLKAEGVQASRDSLADLDCPAVAWVHRDHYVAVLSVQGDATDGTAVVQDPNCAAAQTVPQSQLLAESNGYLLELRR